MFSLLGAFGMCRYHDTAVVDPRAKCLALIGAAPAGAAVFAKEEAWIAESAGFSQRD